MSYKTEENDLMKFYLREYYLPNAFKDGELDWTQTNFGIELITRTRCNQTCDYCYIHNHGHEMYPYNASNEEYLTNTKAVVNFLLKYKMYVRSWDIFAGDILGDKLFFDVVKILEYYWEEVSKSCNLELTGIDILFPLNTSMLGDDNYRNELINYQQTLREKRIYLHFSISTDGLYAVEHREKNSIDQDFYDKLFEFASITESGFHPMISPENVEHGVENLKWWNSMYTKYGRTLKSYPFYLHVRNDGWTDEKIQDYIKFVECAWNIRWEQLNHNAEEMARYMFVSSITEYSEGFDPAIIHTFCGRAGDEYTCTIQHNLFIDVGTMRIPVCHRLAYPQFIGGKFVVENNEIVDIDTQNFIMWASIHNINPLTTPKCDKCSYKYICMKGCLGSQFEVMGEAILPINSVCKLEQARTKKLLSLAKKNGIIKVLMDKDMLPSKIAKQAILSACEEVEDE